MASHPDDLDQLLNSALDDFQTLNFTPTQGNEDKTKEEIEKKASLPMNVQGLGLGLGLPDLKANKMVQKKAPNPAQSHISETLDQLRQHTREAVKNFESMSGGPKVGEDLSKDIMMEEWVKQFEEFAGSQDMESMMDTLMQQLLSEDILHEPMKEIGERYPKWLEDHKSTLSEEDYTRYSHQYKLIHELNGVYDSEPDNFIKIVELMQKMQECGEPPNDIMHELAPGFDVSNFGQLSPDMLGAQQNCSIM